MALLRPSCEYFLSMRVCVCVCVCSPNGPVPNAPAATRCFSTTAPALNWLQPKMPEKDKSRKGRPRMHTGGSSRGTTVVWGDYGLRMRDHDRRVSADQLRIGYEAIQRRLRGMHYRLYTRVSANIGVYTSGNEMRMGKGKGKFDYWAARVPVSRIIFELKGDIHEQVAREAFRLAGHKLPGESSCFWGTLPNNGRSVRICQEGRSTRRRYCKVGEWNYTRVTEAPSSPRSPAYTNTRLIGLCINCIICTSRNALLFSSYTSLYIYTTQTPKMH